MEKEMMHYGSFYPANNLDKIIKTLIDAKKVISPVILITPHAGYYYCGLILGKAYAQIKDLSFENIFILGPSHYEDISSPVVPEYDSFNTPFGFLEVNRNIVRDLVKQKIAIESNLPYEQEHSIEVQLPFISNIYKDKKFPKIVPILLNKYNLKLSDYFKSFVNNSLFIVSSDLSHYLDANKAKDTDAKTIDAIMSLDSRNFAKIDACGDAGIKTILKFATDMKFKPVLIDYMHSGYATKDNEKVVGYTAIGFKK